MERILYPKINTIFKREQQKPNNIILNDFSCPEFKYLYNNIWTFTEKIDGTNIRIMFDPEIDHLIFGGKTENAQIPTHLLESLQNLFDIKLFQKYFNCPVTLYGEGFGFKIQSGGNYFPHSKTSSFILFDVMIAGFWLDEDNVLDIAYKLNIQMVPKIGEGTLELAISKVESGLKSTFGDFYAEGLVIKPKVQLFNRKGEKIITKIKHKDFTSLRLQTHD